MNRREFIRRFVLSSILVGIGVSGVGELANKIVAGQQQLPAAQNSQQAVLQQQQQQQTSQSTLQQSLTNSSGSGGATATTATAATTTTTVQQASASAAPSGYSLVTQLSNIANSTYSYFTHPRFGSSILVNVSGQWKAFSAVCTHAPCTVRPQGSSTLYCPCHGGTFSTTNGSVQRGPPPRAISEYGVMVQNGGVYVSDTIVN